VASICRIYVHISSFINTAWPLHEFVIMFSNHVGIGLL